MQRVQQRASALPVVCHLIGRLSKELGAPLAEAFYAIVVVLVLQAAGLASGPFLLTDNCVDDQPQRVWHGTARIRPPL